jgi:hypothetical protein
LFQDPVLAVNASPTAAVPLIVGRAVFAGSGSGTSEVAAELMVADPPALVAVTTTASVWFSSAATTV